MGIITPRLLVLLFPVIPIIGVFFSILGKYVLKRNCTGYIIPLVSIAQILIGLKLIYEFLNIACIFTVEITPWDYTIIFSFCRYRVYFITAYLIPVFLFLFKRNVIGEENLRIIFLFFLTGCSGLIVTGDVFNFYVFYELMIISAYLIISINNKNYYSLKYMFFGSVSSAFLLAGIILLLASGSYFSLSHLNEIAEFPAANTRFLFLFFLVAFFIKSSFFPFYPVALCHSATKPSLATFFSSFTIFSGILGIMTFVLLPAETAGYDGIFFVLRIVSALTILTAAFFLYFETEILRFIAGSTVYSMGFTGLLLSFGRYEAALLYMVIHAVFKSLFFYLADEMNDSAGHLKIQANPIIIMLAFVALWFTAGAFPTPIYFIKDTFIQENTVLSLILYFSLFFLTAGFFKFSFSFTRKPLHWPVYSLILIMLTIIFVLFPYPYAFTPYKLFIDYIILAGSFLLGRTIFMRLPYLNSLDRKYVYPNLNAELFYIFIFFFVQFLLLQKWL